MAPDSRNDLRRPRRVAPDASAAARTLAVGTLILALLGVPGVSPAFAQCDPPAGLLCAVGCAPVIVDLSWDFTPGTVAIDIFRDGTLVATLGGSDTSWTDASPPAPVGTYEVRRICATGGPSDSALCRVVTGSAWPAHVIWDAEGGLGLVASAPSLEGALATLGEPSFTTPDLVPAAGVPACAGFPGPGTVIWALLGTYPDNHPLTEEEGQFLAEAVVHGAAVVLSGADVFAFDPPTAFSDWDGVADGADDGDDSFLGMIGVDHRALLVSGFDAAYTQDQAGSDYTDRIEASATDAAGICAQTIWLDDGSGGSLVSYATGVHYVTDANRGDVVSQSWEVGGYGGPLEDLVDAYLDALRPGCPGPAYLHCVRNCTPGLETVELVWINGTVYSEILVCRDGQLQAILPGCANGWIDTAPLPTASTYRVIGVCGATPSCSTGALNPSQAGDVRCGVGTADPISLTCVPNGSGGVTLSWTSTVSYERYVVLVDGICWAVVPGTATSFDIPVLPTGGPTVCIFGEGLSTVAPAGVSFTADCRKCCSMVFPGTSSTQFHRGDANADGHIDIADGIFLCAALFTVGAPQPPCADAADADDDGAVDLADVLFGLTLLFSDGGPPAPLPGTACGEDPTDDSLDCAVFEPCQ